MFYEATDSGRKATREVTELFIEFAEALDEIVPNCRNKSILLTKLEEGAYHAKAALSRDLETR